MSSMRMNNQGGRIWRAISLVVYMTLLFVCQVNSQSTARLSATIPTTSTTSTVTIRTRATTSSHTSSTSTPISSTTVLTGEATTTTAVSSSSTTTLALSMTGSVPMTMQFKYGCQAYFSNADNLSQVFISTVSYSVRMNPLRLSLTGAWCESASTILSFTLLAPLPADANDLGYTHSDASELSKQLLILIQRHSLVVPEIGQALSAVVFCNNGQAAPNNDFDQCNSLLSDTAPLSTCSCSKGWTVSTAVLAAALCIVLLVFGGILVYRRECGICCFASKSANILQEIEGVPSLPVRAVSSSMRNIPLSPRNDAHQLHEVHAAEESPEGSICRPSIVVADAAAEVSVV